MSCSAQYLLSTKHQLDVSIECSLKRAYIRTELICLTSTHYKDISDAPAEAIHWYLASYRFADKSEQHASRRSLQFVTFIEIKIV